jgi:hypothetical protein
MWRPATIAEVNRIVQENLESCIPEEAEAFRQFAVEPFEASLTRYDRPEHVVVVARKDDRVIYWEDVEEGFNESPVGPDGAVLEHWCNQDDLGQAIRRWM